MRKALTRDKFAKAVFFPSSSDFRNWLESSHQNHAELFVGFYKKLSGKPSITYPEALTEALCFGWIDGVRKSLGSDAYMVRFTPRKPHSQWSAVNIRHVERLMAAGQMRPAGLQAFAGAKGQTRNYSHEQRNEARYDPAEEHLLRASRKAWDFFQSQPPWYRRTATYWVVSAKKKETRQKRLETLISDCQHGQLIKSLTRPGVPKRQKKKQ